jgi:hypothetical protein
MAQQGGKGGGKPAVQSKEIPNKPAVQPKGIPSNAKPGVAAPPKGGGKK